MALCAATRDASVKISLDGLGKRYRQQWVFRNLEQTLHSPQKIAILGHNGSGKSTFLRTVAGIQAPSEGRIFWEISGKPLPKENVFRRLSFCAPGMELIEELTLDETLAFHFRFKPLLSGIALRDIPAMLGLQNARHKPLSDFSSGMKQRVKLALTLFADTPVALLDEPCTNLDDAGIAQYLGWVDDYCKEKLVVVASNDPREYPFCDLRLPLSNR